MGKQCFRVDENGIIDELDSILIGEEEEVPEGYKEGWGGNRSLHNPIFDFELNDWVERRTEQDVLENAKTMKMEQLSKACSNHIVGRFKAFVDGTEYYFSCDHEAQINFMKSEKAFEKGWIASAKWTCYDMDGNVHRVTLTVENFEPVYVGHLVHVQSGIAKLRDYLQPLVMQAQTLEEVENIKW